VLARDLDAARAYLEEAGAVDSDNDGIVEYNGEPLAIELLVRSDKPIYERYGELLQSNLAEVGVSITLKIVDVAEFRAISEQEHTNQAMVSKFTAYGMSAGAGMGAIYMSAAGSCAQGQITDEEYAAIVGELGSAVTIEEYYAAAKECQEYYAENMPAIALYWDCYIQAYNSRLSGFVVDVTCAIFKLPTWFTIEQKPVSLNTGPPADLTNHGRGPDCKITGRGGTSWHTPNKNARRHGKAYPGQAQEKNASSAIKAGWIISTTLSPCRELKKPGR
jgi:peptide/nickel transport system substrate-binding protein